MRSERYTDDPNSGGTCSSEELPCYDRSIYTHVNPEPANLIKKAWQAVSPYLPACIHSEKSYQDIKRVFKYTWKGVMTFTTSKVLNGAPMYSEVDAYIEWRHARLLQKLIWSWNACGTFFVIFYLANHYGGYSIPAVVRRVMGLSHLGVVLITMASINFFLPPPTKGETGLPITAYFAYGLLSSAVELAFATASETYAKFIRIDLAFTVFCILLWIKISISLRYRTIMTREAIIEIVRRDYGALDLKFFNDVQKMYKEVIGDDCPIEVEGGKLYIVHAGSSDSHSNREEVEIKPQADFARSWWGELRSIKAQQPEV